MDNYYEKNKEERKAYQKEWTAKNKEKIKEYAKTYYEKHKEQILERQRSRRNNQPRTRRTDNYIHITVDNKHHLEHRYIWEQANGPIPRGYIVHHINGNIQDNRLENLLCISRKEHYRIHKEEEIKSTGSEYYNVITKNWVSNNREKWNEYQKEWKQNTGYKKKFTPEYNKEYYQKHKDRYIEYALKYYYENKEKISQKRKETYQLKKQQKNVLEMQSV